MPDFTPAQWALLLTAALLSGMSKTALNGIGPFVAAIAASVMPAGESTGMVLVLLIGGDFVAITAYRAHADWRVIRRLLPAVVIGILLGVVFMSRVDATVFRRTLGAVLLVLAVMQLLQGRKPALVADRHLPRWLTNSAGATAGFTSMLANAGGPVMNLYLLSVKSGIGGFLGTTAWLFFIINLTKLPFSIGLGLLTWDVFTVALVCTPAMLVGAFLGLRIAKRMTFDGFKRMVLVFTAIAAVNLMR